VQRSGSFFFIKTPLIFLLFTAPLVQYRVEVGSFSFALMEPVVLLASTVWLIHQMMCGQLTILKDPLVLIFMAMAFWAFMVRPWAVNWQNGLSDVRDWLIPLLGFVTFLTTTRRGWRTWIGVFLILVWLNAWLGIYQHIADGFRPFITEGAAYKTGFLVSPESGRFMQVSFAVGFFSHPNAYAMYLFAGLMIALGKLQENQKKLPFFILVVLPLVFALYWTFAKASLLVALGLIPLYWLNHRIKSTPALLGIASASLVTGALVLWSAIKYVPSAVLITFWWRVGLWQIALSVLSDHPQILFLGNGLELFAQSAYYGQPHNLYVYSLLQYGLPGFSLILILAGYFWTLGLRLRKNGLMRAHPLLAALWFAVIGYFVIGLVESNLMGIENRMIFMILAACLIGLAREVSVERTHKANNAGVAYEKKTASVGVI
jgi:O-antigen ligase